MARAAQHHHFGLGIRVKGLYTVHYRLWYYHIDWEVYWVICSHHAAKKSSLIGHRDFWGHLWTEKEKTAIKTGSWRLRSSGGEGWSSARYLILFWGLMYWANSSFIATKLSRVGDLYWFQCGGSLQIVMIMMSQSLFWARQLKTMVRGMQLDTLCLTKVKANEFGASFTKLSTHPMLLSRCIIITTHIPARGSHLPVCAAIHCIYSCINSLHGKFWCDDDLNTGTRRQGSTGNKVSTLGEAFAGELQA